MEEIRISVIIPTYNPGKYLVKCIESLKHQTLDRSKFEVIVVHNGEESFRDFIHGTLEATITNYKYMYSDLPGVSRARNLGLKNAIGKYICFLDDDDFLNENYLLDLLTIGDKSQSDLVISNLLCFSNNKNQTSIDYIGKAILNFKNEETVDLYSAKKFLSSCCGKLILKDDITISFDEDVAQSEDALFMCMNSRKFKKITFCMSSIYFRTIREESASRSKTMVFRRMKNRTVVGFRFFTLLFDNQLNKKLVLNRILAVCKSIIFDIISMFK